jgi:hypothetical protein
LKHTTDGRRRKRRKKTMLTLDQAIQHCKEKAEELREQAGFDTDNERYRMSESEKADCLECAKEHEQLACWLTELKTRRKQEELR